MKVPEALHWLLLAGLLFAPAACNSGGNSNCDVDDDCWNSEVSVSLGRCAPRVVACIERECRADCGHPCRTVDPSVNACQLQGRVCNESESGAEQFTFCTPLRPHCMTAADCPLYRPISSADEQHTWTCEAGRCRYPGLVFHWDE